ncbi:MAG: chemoreceptor glutamine deamidase CheD [Proteobacteria bacterium]|nr:chemoreceptor glutamine deamidase CheD [Pseudomonadota bacterium]
MGDSFSRKGQNRYLDPYVNRWTTKILPGEYAVTAEDELIVTAVGSCIAACIHDTVTGIGGMNHFMLPSSTGGDWAGQNAAARYGNFAMEFLINEILKQGGKKTNLVAKIFGGGTMMPAQLQIGEMNAAFAREYLQTEKIPILAEDVGQGYSRKVYFHPKSGAVTMKKLMVLANDTIPRREADYGKVLSDMPLDGEVELF